MADDGLARTERLDLVPLPAAWLRSTLTGAPRPDLGFSDPDGILDDDHALVRLRLDQIIEDSSLGPWLLRAIVLRETATAVGHVTFHNAPDENGMVEIGYTVVAARRGQGIASEAAQGMWDWAARHGATRLRGSVAPDNQPSLRLLRSAGFVQVGSQVDEIDGLELVFERETEGPQE